jgi:hypothetical protein
MFDFSLTWIASELDGLIHSHIRRWIETPISTCLDEVLCLPQNKCRTDIPSLKNYAATLCLSKRNCLKTSENFDISQLWSVTSSQNVNSDAILTSNDAYKISEKVLKAEFKKESFNHVLFLPVQGASIKPITDNLTSNEISAWSKEINKLPALLYNFIRKSLMQQLATNGNLRRWGKATDGLCQLCKNSQTNKHVLSNCNSPAALERYKVRHDAILKILCQWIDNTKHTSAELFADIICYKPLSNIFNRLRPDIAVVCNEAIHILELTVCHETNLAKSKDSKRQKYASIKLIALTNIV